MIFLYDVDNKQEWIGFKKKKKVCIYYGLFDHKIASFGRLTFKHRWKPPFSTSYQLKAEAKLYTISSTIKIQMTLVPVCF